MSKTSTHGSCVVAAPPPDLSLGGSTLVGFFYLLLCHPHKTKHMMYLGLPWSEHYFDQYSLENSLGCEYTTSSLKDCCF
jgi:hypothetical protein